MDPKRTMAIRSSPKRTDRIHEFPWVPSIRDRSAREKGQRRSRQLALAAEPQVFLRLQSRHPEQEAEHVELVASRQPDQVGGGPRNEGCGLIGPAVL